MDFKYLGSLFSISKDNSNLAKELPDQNLGAFSHLKLPLM